MSFVITAIIMFVFWILLSGETDPILIGSGIVSSLFVSYISHDLLIGSKIKVGPAVVKTLRFLIYLPWLMWQIVLSNIDLVYRTLHPSMPIDPSIIEFDTDIETDKGITILANSITLTPGTVTIKAHKDGHFKVHAIAKKAADGLLAGDMQRKVRAIEKD